MISHSADSSYRLFTNNSHTGGLPYSAIRAAKEAVPKIYDLTPPRSQFLRQANPTQEPGLLFFVVGCQGNAKEAQKEVAKLMEKITSEQLPDFLLFLGDNFYDYGVDSPDSEVFRTHFEEIYAPLKKLGIPAFVILGNHDENLHKANMLISKKGIDRGMNEVAYSYYPDKTYRSVDTKKALYQHSNPGDTAVLNLADLPLWNMPSRFYSLRCSQTQLFCIDSNTYVADYLKLLTQVDSHTITHDFEFIIPEINQADWLNTELKKATQQKKKTILALHHPPITQGIRKYHSDLGIYLSDKEIDQLKNLFPTLFSDKLMPSYNKMLHEIFKKQELIFDVTLAAHDHNLSYFNDKPIEIAPGKKPTHTCLVVAGGGGGSIQKRKNFSDHPHLGCFLEHHGFAVIKENTHDNDHYSIDIYTVPSPEMENGFHLKFTSQSPKPIRCYPEQTISQEEQNKIEKFCSVINTALTEYFEFLSEKQKDANGNFLSKSIFHGNMSHGIEGVTRANNAWGYISHYQADNYVKTVQTIYKLTKWQGTFSMATDHSLLTLINKHIEENYPEYPLDSTFALENFLTQHVNPLPPVPLKRSSFK